MDKYKPLPEGLRIQKSKIQGFGLFTLLFLKQRTNLGISHIKIKDELEPIINAPMMDTE